MTTTPDTHTVLSERNFYVTLTGVRGGQFGGDIGPAIATVLIAQRNGVSTTGHSYTPSYYVRIDGRHAFGGFAHHLSAAGLPAIDGGGMIWGPEVVEASATTRVIVRCQDGACRHLDDSTVEGGSFTTLAGARIWADMGHCCTNVHTFELVETLGSEGCIVLAGIDGPTLWECECESCRNLQDPSWDVEDDRS